MPRIPSKPPRPTVTPEQLEKSLSKVSEAVKEATDADGNVDLKAVEAKLQGDPLTDDAVKVIKGHDAFERTETRTHMSCGSPGRSYEVQVAPSTLKGAEVQSVLSALIAAKVEVDQKDQNRDGVISEDEGRQAGGGGLAGKLADAAARGAFDDFDARMDDWAATMRGLRENVRGRGIFDAEMQRVCGHHAKTDLGRDALVWGFRDEVVGGAYLSARGNVETRLRDAETSWLARLPFSKADQKPGHLSDKEIAGLLGTSDLKAFVAEKRAALEGTLGGSFEETWLKGSDLEGAEQMHDPDVDARTRANPPASC